MAKEAHSCLKPHMTWEQAESSRKSSAKRSPGEKLGQCLSQHFQAGKQAASRLGKGRGLQTQPMPGLEPCWVLELEWHKEGSSKQGPDPTLPDCIFVPTRRETGAASRKVQCLCQSLAGDAVFHSGQCLRDRAGKSVN